MKLETLAINDERLNGAVLAHAQSGKTHRRVTKGTILDQALIADLHEAGHASLIVAVLGADDVGEDEAADRLARALQGSNIKLGVSATGRVNIYSRVDGVLTFDPMVIHAFNAVSAQVTIATALPFARVGKDHMVATVKIIPFAVPQNIVDQAISVLEGQAISVQPFRLGLTARLVQTELPTTKASVLDKTARVLGDRFTSIGVTLGGQDRCAHTVAALAARLVAAAKESNLIIAFGASAVCDDDDIIPAAIRKAGGDVEHVGMPVDPGNLLVFGTLGQTTVIGAPGCARSPKLNGFDWVLERWAAGVPVDAAMIRQMGVGGLLTEIETRPRPRNHDEN